MRYANEQHLRGVDPLCDLAYCAASNLANIVPPTVIDGIDPSPTIETAAMVFEMGVSRLVDLSSQLGVTEWPDSVGYPVETYYDRRERGETGRWTSALNGAVLPAAIIGAADVPTPQGARLLRMVEAAIVTDRVAHTPVAQATILSVVQPPDGREFGQLYNLHQGYLEQTMLHYPSKVWGGVKSVVRGVVGVADVVRYVAAEQIDDGRQEPAADFRTFGY